MNKNQKITVAFIAVSVLIVFTGPIVLNSSYDPAFAESHTDSQRNKIITFIAILAFLAIIAALATKVSHAIHLTNSTHLDNSTLVPTNIH